MEEKQQIPARRLFGFALAGSLALCNAGCGTPAAPLPPSLSLPTPVANLSASRVGNAVRLTWTMPSRTTDKVVLRNPVDVQVCRALGGGSCIAVASLSLPPALAGAYNDELPADLAQGPDRLLRYEVAMRNHAGKSAGQSNAAYSVAGASPPPLSGLTGQVRADGVLLTWVPAPQPGRPMTFRIERLETTPSAAEPRPRSPLAPSAPATQILAVHTPDGTDPGHAVDASAQFNRQYRYVVERVATPDLSGHPVEVEGPPSDPILVNTTDTFAPETPQGLAAVADSAAGAIDLSWTPDTESDLAAYHVYRRDAQGDGQPQSIAIVRAETSFRDTGVLPGHTYAYSVSASDQSNNESHRSLEVEETLPAR